MAKAGSSKISKTVAQPASAGGVSEAASADGGFDLVVHEGDRVTLSYNVERFKPYYKILKPKNIDEVKEAIGVPKDVQINRTPLRLVPLTTVTN